MKSIILVNGNGNCSELLSDLSGLLEDASMCVDIHTGSTDECLFVTDLCDIQQCMQRYNCNPNQIIAIGHCKKSYDNLCTDQTIYNMLKCYIVVDNRLRDYSIKSGILRNPHTLPYSLHARAYNNCKRFDLKFKVLGDSSILEQQLDVENTNIVFDGNYEGVHAVIYEDKLDIQKACRAICAGSILVGRSCEYMNMLSDHGLSYIIPTDGTASSYINNLSLGLEYIRTTPKIQLNAAISSYNYSRTMLDWSVNFSAWKSLFDKIRCL